MVLYVVWCRIGLVPATCIGCFESCSIHLFSIVYTCTSYCNTEALLVLTHFKNISVLLVRARSSAWTLLDLHKSNQGNISNLNIYFSMEREKRDTRKHTHTLTLSYTHTHTLTHSHTHTLTHSHTHTLTHSHTHTLTHSHTYSHNLTHSHSHSHSNTRTQTLTLKHLT